MSLQDRYIDSIRKWRNEDIKNELHRIGLSNSGNKIELVLRLQDFLRTEFGTHPDNVTRGLSPPVSQSTTTTPPHSPTFTTSVTNTTAGFGVFTPMSSYPPHGGGFVPQTFTTTSTTHITPNISQPLHYNATPHQTHTTNMNTMPHLASAQVYPHTTANTTQHSELRSLQCELQILKTKEEIRKVQHRLTLPLDASNISQQDTAMNNSMLNLVKKSVDINSLPPTKPFVFSGNAIDYPRWRSMFDLMVESKDLHPHQKLVYLEEFLSGEALDAVQGLNVLSTPDAYIEARKILDDRFGDPYDIADAYIDKLEKWSQIDPNDSKGLRKYSDFLRQVTVAKQTFTELSRLDDPRVLRCFPNTLPPTLLYKWSRLAGSHKLDNKSHATFEQYAEFVKKESFLANDNTTSLSALNSTRRNTPTNQHIKHKSTHISHATSSTDNQETPSRPTAICHICQTFAKHHTSECPTASSHSAADLRSLIVREKLCSSCLRRGHQSTACYATLKCSTCSGNHASCLHGHEILSCADYSQ